MGYIKYSFSKLDDANYCLMRYYLRWVEKASHPNPPFFFKGAFFHGLVEHFWERLGNASEVRRNVKGRVVSEKKYTAAEEFADYVHGQWMRGIIQNRNSSDPKRRVDWDYSGQEYVMANEAKNIARHLFNHLVEIGKPLYQEVPFDFIIGNRKFNGRIDGIRVQNSKIKVEDYKTGQPWMGAMKVNHDPQMSIYNVGIAALCFKDGRFAESLGLKDRRTEFVRNPTYLVEEIENRFIMLEAPAYWARVGDKKKIETVPLIHPTHRKTAHFYEVLKMLDGVEKSIKYGIIYPERGRKCDACVMKKPCAARLEDAVTEVSSDIRGQVLFPFNAPIFVLPTASQELAIVNVQEELFQKKKRKTTSV